MTSDEADQRIFLSQHTLTKYAQMTFAGADPMPGTLVLVHEEIIILEAVAEEHPGKASRIIPLMVDWVTFGDRLRVKLN